MRISDWSSDVCSSDLPVPASRNSPRSAARPGSPCLPSTGTATAAYAVPHFRKCDCPARRQRMRACRLAGSAAHSRRSAHWMPAGPLRSEEHTSELQSLMRISYAVFCLKKKKKNRHSYSKEYNKTKHKADNTKTYSAIQV